MLGVVALAWAILYAGRRFGVPQMRGPMQLLGRLPLEPRRAICLVKIGDKLLVVGTSEAGVTKLAELDAAELPETTTERPKSFSVVLQQALGRPSPPVSSTTTSETSSEPAPSPDPSPVDQKRKSEA